MAQATPQGQVQAKPPTPPGISAASIQATQAKWRHGQQEVTLDLQRVLNPDVHSGFRNIEDAVTRLLPYHVCLTEEPEETDWAEHVAEVEAGGPGLACSRAQQWTAYCDAKSEAIVARTEKLQARFEQSLAKRRADSQTALLPDELWQARHYAYEEEANKKRRLQTDIKDAHTRIAAMQQRPVTPGAAPGQAAGPRPVGAPGVAPAGRGAGGPAPGQPGLQQRPPGVAGVAGPGPGVRPPAQQGAPARPPGQPGAQQGVLGGTPAAAGAPQRAAPGQQQQPPPAAKAAAGAAQKQRPPGHG